FIRDAELSASLSLAATNVAAAAKIGFLGVGVTGGSASLEAAATVRLQNPLATSPASPLASQPIGADLPLADTMPPADNLPLPTFTSLLLSNPGSLIAPPPRVS